MKSILIILSLIGMTSCATFKKTRNDQIESCVDRFVDRVNSQAVDSLFKHCKEMYQ